MKKIIILAILLMIWFTGHSQVNSSCSITKELREAYEDDIYWLAYNRIIETNSPFRDSLKIPIEVEDTIRTGLAAIFNASFIPERDSVFDIYCIHHEICTGQLNTLYVFVDTSYSWTNQWKNNETITGYDELDKFLSDYNYKLQNFAGYGILISDDHINFDKFTDSLKKFNGITDVWQGGTTCCHNDLFYEKTYFHQYFTFDLGFGHGIMICPNHYIWKFDIDNNCSVNLIESRHEVSDPGYPDNMKIKNCYITSEIRNPNEIKSFINISPNPANGFITIKSESKLNYSVSDYDLFGRKVYANKFTERLEINLSDYQSGLYFIGVSNEENTIRNNFKIIKE
jgi:hypothetical protein